MSDGPWNRLEGDIVTVDAGDTDVLRERGDCGCGTAGVDDGDDEVLDDDPVDCSDCLSDFTNLSRRPSMPLR